MDWIDGQHSNERGPAPESGAGATDVTRGIAGRRRTRLAILLGGAAAMIALMIALVAHSSSQSMSRQHVAEDILVVSGSLAEHFDGIVNAHESTEIDALDYVANYWSQKFLPTLGENLCIVDSNGTVVLSTLFPDMVGTNVTDMEVALMAGDENVRASTMGDAMRTGSALSGTMIDPVNGTQLFGLAPSPSLDGFTMLHLPEEESLGHAGYDRRPWIIGSLLLVVLVPLSVGLMYTAVNRMEAEQTVARLAASEIERRYRRLFETNGAVQMLIDPNDGGLIRDANRAACEFYGCDLDELKQRSLAELSERSESVVRTTLEAATRGQVHTTSQHIRADEAVRDISVDAGPVEIDGKIMVFAVIQDITELAEKNRQIQESEAKYRSLFEQANDAVFILDPGQHIILDVNETAVSRYGYPREELLGLSLDDLSADDWRLALRRGMEEGAVSNGAVTFEHLHRHRDGHDIPVEVSGRRVTFGGRDVIQAIVRDLTDRKRTEADLRQRNELLSLITDNSNDLIYIRDANGRIIYVSPSVERLTGYTPDEYASVAATLPVENSPLNVQSQSVLDSLAEVVPGARVPEYFTEIRHREGTSRIHRVNERWVHDRDGNVVLIGTAADVTAGRLAEEALRENEARLRLLVSQIPAMVWTTDRQLRVTSIAGAGLQALNLKPEDLEGRFLHEVIEPEDDDGESIAIDAHESALRGESVSFEATWRSQRLHTHVEPLTDEQDVTIGCIGIALDVTERRQAEIGLARERDLVNTLLELVPDSIYFKDPFSRYQRVNQAHARLLGLDEPREAEGKTDRDFFPPEFAKATLAGEQRIMATGKPAISEIEHVVDAAGEDRWMLTTRIPIHDNEGHVEGTVGISKDVSKLHLAEQRLKHSEREYRSLALTRQLLLSELNHRVKNNLNNLMELVRLASPNMQSTQDLSESMLARLNAMAAVHDIFAARGFDEVDLRELFLYVIPRLEASQGISQSVHVEGPSVSILRDQAEKIAMIVQELLTNSRKYGAHSSPEGTASLTWTVYEESEEEIKVRMHWQERGGPTPVEPTSFGLGLGTLVSGFARHTLNGSCVYQWDPPGFGCILSASMVKPVEQDPQRPFADVERF